MNNIFEQNVIKTWGDKGQHWLTTLPATVAVLAKQWNLTKLVPVGNLSFNYVVTGFRGQSPIVLKIGCDQNEINRELAALKAYDGKGSVRLIDSSMAHNALLLEQVIPGESLVSFFPDNDDQAIEIVANIMQQLHVAPLPSDASMPTLRDEFNALYKPHPDLDVYHIHKAQALFMQLVATQRKTVLLHGDLHHGNIVLSQRGWLAIDPKGLLGDPAYEVCAFIRNPQPEKVKPKELIKHRIELFANLLAIDEQRLFDWLYVRAILEACWAMHDGLNDPEKALAEAKNIVEGH